MILIPSDLKISIGNSLEIIVQEATFKNKEKVCLNFKLSNELMRKFEFLRGNEKVIIKNGQGSYAVVDRLANVLYSDMLYINKCYYLFYGSDGVNNVKHFVVCNTSCCARRYCKHRTNLKEAKSTEEGEKNGVE